MTREVRSPWPSWIAATAAAVALVPFAAGQAGGEPQIRINVAPYRPQSITIPAQSNLVPLEVVVRNSAGAVITGLTRTNFRVMDDGAEQPLAQFSVKVRAPAVALPPGAPRGATAQLDAPAAPRRYVALFFDDVNTADGDLLHARNAALEFLRASHSKQDWVGVFTASGTQDLAFTQSTLALRQAVGAVRAHPRANQYGLQASCPRITPYQAYEISVLHFDEPLKAALAEKAACSGAVDDLNGVPVSRLDPGALEPVLAQAEATWTRTRAISQDTLAQIGAVVDALTRQPGKRVLLLASGGFYAETLGAGQEKIVDAALRGNVVIDSLDAKGLYTEELGRSLGQESDAGVLPLITFFYEESSQLPSHQEENAAMVQLAQATGGLFFHNNNDLALGFRRLGLAPALTYELALAPARLPRDGKFHRLRVDLTPPIKGAVVQARRGYFDPQPETPLGALGPALDAALQRAVQQNELPVKISVSASSAGVAVDARFTPRTQFINSGGRHRQVLVIIAGLYKDDGGFVAGKRGTLAIAFDGAKYKYFRSHGLGATLRLAAPPGRYQLRAAVGEGSDGKITMVDRPIVIP